ncbi:hypothetical protein Lbys_1094 [Leadbetterella byssophila DSM 17132]|uniref:Sialate O-acetylesterase domain-containing protein n=1 Tax=Leadbetterella byssophila (strain DSM 17132 / JCM 16389 / KACC 11308 / NBRC 106382 / 4M15) TaxID=649349 RepID=E4RSX8_LEAB4|nr:hypothetical protein [Leadbetterella byssophila]ADQ16817.1 hypothetical protein Lbys_1094 [Leadbetterella byssophila DSM 17132]
MKQAIILFVFLIAATSNTYSQDISFPIDRAVFQRSSNSAAATATVTFAGEFTENASGSGTTNNSTYEIRRLRIDGVDLGAYISPTTFSGSQKTRIGTSVGYTFYFTLNVPTGWYQLNVKNGSNSVVKSIKFGVGEVFVIAGQSNAQGYGATGFGYSAVNNTYDCIGSLKNVQNIGYWGGGVGYVSDYVNLERPVFGLLRYTTDIANPANNNPWIGPNSTRTWYYLWLGERLAKTHSASPLSTTNGNYTTQPPVPIMFYNAAIAGTSINNWEGSMKKTKGFFNSTYTNPLNNSNNPYSIPNFTDYPSNTPWDSNNEYDILFTVFKNVLSFYGGMFGVRTVIWHQGEAETKTLSNLHNAGVYSWQGPVPTGYNVKDYGTKLKAIIDESRVILPNLKWTIFRTSLIAEELSSSGTLHENIVNNHYYLYPPSQSWLYSWTGTAPTSPVQIGSNDVNANVIKQQENLQASNSSYISLAEDTDNYASSVGFMGRQADATHFNGTALYWIGLGLFASSPSSDALTKAPVLPTPIPKPIITGSSGSYTVSLQAPSGVSYVSHQWHANTSSNFNQAASNSTPNFTMNYSNNSFTGYVKDNTGRISIIPYGHIIGVSGARVSNESTMTIFPNPIAANEDLSIEYEVLDESLEDVVLEVVNDNGKVLYTETLKKTKSGENKWIIKRNLLGKTSDFDFLYVRITDGEKVSTKKLIILH